MELSAEERRKIYEEEKARIEAGESRKSGMDLKPEMSRSPDAGNPGRTRRITSSSLAIVWSLILLLLFHVFRHYLAYYQLEEVNGVSGWKRYEILTPEFDAWLPLLTVTLILTIASHIVLVIYDKYVLRQSLVIVLNVLGIITTASLLLTFPFSFASIPDMDEVVLNTMMRLAIIGVLVVLAVITLVKIMKFLVRLVTGTAGYGTRE